MDMDSAIIIGRKWMDLNDVDISVRNRCFKWPENRPRNLPTFDIHLDYKGLVAEAPPPNPAHQADADRRDRLMEIEDVRRAAGRQSKVRILKRPSTGPPMNRSATRTTDRSMEAPVPTQGPSPLVLEPRARTVAPAQETPPLMPISAGGTPSSIRDHVPLPTERIKRHRGNSWTWDTKQALEKMERTLRDKTRTTRLTSEPSAPPKSRIDTTGHSIEIHLVCHTHWHWLRKDPSV